MNRCERRIRRSIREWLVGVNHRGRRTVLCDRERLVVEAPDEALLSLARRVGFDLAIVPGDPKRFVRDLEDKKAIGRVGCEMLYFEIQDLDWAELGDLDLALGLR